MALKIPLKIRAGDSLNFTAALPGYSAADGWTLKITLVNSKKVYEITSTASGSEHLVKLLPAATQGWIPGFYKYVASVSDGTDKYTIESAGLQILPNLTTDKPVDERHHVEKVLDAIEAVLEGKATKDQLEVTFQGRSITHLTPEQLLVWRDKYRSELRAIKQAERVARGLGSGRKILVRL